MRFVIQRPLRLLALITAAGLLLAGCGPGPNKVGAAAIVGDTRIPVADVQSWFEAVLAKEEGLKPRLREQEQMDELGRQLASYSIQQELLRQAAETHGISVDEREVAELVDSMGGADAATRNKIYTPRNFEVAARSQLIAVELGRKHLDRLAITFDFTQAATRDEAETKAKRMAQGPEEAAELVDAELQAGTPAGRDERLRAAENVQLAGATPLFGARPGTVVAFEPQPQAGQWLIARIKERDTDAPPIPAAAQADDQTLQAVGMRMLGVTADRVGVRLSPRYGVWDQVGLGSAPDESQTRGFWLSGPAESS
ncbi:SurA N-terminal domain-containing protein [Parasphingorhabdus pacifica]